ncbi:MAG: hypothetical protein VX966_05390 [Chloroflexota bacterium]|nr:hypothetical protein [Chloroflexota bacterium]
MRILAGQCDLRLRQVVDVLERVGIGYLDFTENLEFVYSETNMKTTQSCRNA